MWRTASRPLDSERTARVTFAPSLAKLRVNWKPMPELAPVTIAVFPVRSAFGKGRGGEEPAKAEVEELVEGREGEKKAGAELLRQDGVECHVDGTGKHRESVEVESRR